MTDILNHEQFEALLRDEYGDTIPRPALIQSFEAEELLDDDWQDVKTKALKAMLLNVATPSMYTDRKGQVMVILPHGPLTYQMINGFFPVKNAWAYTFSATVGADLDERDYFFRYGRDEEDGNEPVPAFKPNDIKTH